MQTPFFKISEKKVIEQFEIIENIADIVSYSSKTNPDITKILETKTKSMFSVHFKNELKHQKDLSRTLFIAQAWTKEDVSELIKKGIKYFVVDNESDLDILIDYLKESDDKINLFLRLKLREKTIRTEKYFVFGMDSDVINKRILELKENKKIEKIGIHFHRKTQNMSEWNLQYELENILSEETIKNIDFINIGGGLPSEYANTNMNVFESIFRKLNEFKDWLHDNNIKLWIEPGRFIAAPAGKLITKIIGIYENNVIVDASIYNSDMDAIIVPVKLLIEEECPRESVKEEGVKAYVIKGITPCSLDLFRYRAYLKNPKVGDTITFLNAGAYNFRSDFCDLEKIPTEVIENE